MLFDKFIDFVWPSENAAEYHEIAGRRALNLFFLMAGLSGLIMTAINASIFLDEPVIVTAGFIASCMSLLGPLYMRRAKSFRKVARNVCVLGCGVLIAIAFDNGHFLSSSLTLLPSLLVIATLALGMRTGLVIVAVMAALYGAIFFFHHMGEEGASPVIYSQLNWTEVLVVHCLSLILLIIGAAIFQYEMMRATENLKAAHDKAKQANQAKSDFLANMSHEIRTPMNGVLGMAQALKQTSLTQKQSLYADTISSSGAALLTIINDILDFSKIEAGKLTFTPRPANFKSAVDEVVVLLGEAAREKQVALSVEWAAPLPDLVEVDIGRLRQVLTNLVGNAIKFTDKGQVTIRVTARENAGRAQWRVEVEDTGIGIADDKLGLVFKKFEQAENSTRRAYYGTGLGLTITHHLVEAMGGRIGVNSRLGVGSLFWFELETPIVKHAPSHLEMSDRPNSEGVSFNQVAADRDAPEGAPSRTEPAKILIAEDNMVNRLVVESLIDKAAFELSFVENGQEALDAVKEQNFDLVLMDISMPVMDGIEATKAIRAFEQDHACVRTPIIALTAHAVSGDKERFLQANIDDYLTKPVQQDNLCAVLDKWVADKEARTKVA